MKMLFRLLPLFFFIISACTPKEPEAVDTVCKEVAEWRKQPWDKSPNMLLTNGVLLWKDSTLSGASAFLVDINGEIYGLTQRDLWGRFSEKLFEDYDYQVRVWYLWPRDRQKDTAKVQEIQPEMAKEQLKHNVLVMNLREKPKQIQALKIRPSSDSLVVGERLYLLGCPYSLKKCLQQVYEMKFGGYENGVLVIDEAPNFNLTGFNGAPIIDGCGRAVGMLKEAGQVVQGDREGMGVVTAEPLSFLLEKPLKPVIPKPKPKKRPKSALK